MEKEIEIYLRIAGNIRNIIRQKGLKQAFVADQIGLSPQKFNDVISGRRRIKVSELVMTAEVLQVSTDELCGKGV